MRVLRRSASIFNHHIPRPAPVPVSVPVSQILHIHIIAALLKPDAHIISFSSSMITFKRHPGKSSSGSSSAHATSSSSMP